VLIFIVAILRSVDLCGLRSSRTDVLEADFGRRTANEAMEIVKQFRNVGGAVTSIQFISVQKYLPSKRISNCKA
jgi:hypothetical protein